MIATRSALRLDSGSPEDLPDISAILAGREQPGLPPFEFPKGDCYFIVARDERESVQAFLLAQIEFDHGEQRVLVHNLECRRERDKPTPLGLRAMKMIYELLYQKADEWKLPIVAAVAAGNTKFADALLRHEWYECARVYRREPNICSDKKHKQGGRW